MALHNLEVLYGIACSSQTKTVYTMQSTFQSTPPLPQGYLKMSEFADFPADQEAALAE
jgi:hypothetical protein